MAHGRDFRRAIDRLVSDLTRIAEHAIAVEIERAIALAIDPIERNAERSSKARREKAKSEAALARAARAAERQAERERERAEREAERAERETERIRRKQEREQLKQELKAARDLLRQTKAADKAKVKQETVAAREARHKALTQKSEKAAPPPVVVFKRSRDGQLTVLQPRPVEAEGNATVVAAAAAPVA